MVVAALDAQTLQAWRELRVHVLDFSEFGDASDFRGIGADQVRLGLGQARVRVRLGVGVRASVPTRRASAAWV